jgi:hypothetical protein
VSIVQNALLKSSLIVAALRRHEPSRARDLALASIYSQVNLIYGPTALPYLHFVVFLVEDASEEIGELGYSLDEEQVHALIEAGERAYRDTYLDGDMLASFRDQLKRMQLGELPDPIITFPGVQA